MRHALLALLFSGCCFPAEDVAEPPAPAEVAPDPEPEPEPVDAEPEPEPEPVTKPAPKPAAKPKPKPKPKPAPKAKATVTILGDAKTAMLLGDGHDAQYTGGGEVDVGAYKLKAWWQNDPVPVVALRFAVAEGETKVITCSSAQKWCKSGEHDFGSLDTGR